MPKFYTFLLTFLYCILMQSVSSLAQNEITEEKPCMYDEHQSYLLENDPLYKAANEAFERFYLERVAYLKAHPGESQVPYTIPVVVHIIHDGAAIGTTSNPTEAAVENIITQASQRFRHVQPGAPTFTNPNYGADTEINLCLAKTDPNGFATSGVLRYYDPTNAVGPYTTIGPAVNASAWDKTRYCNLYVVKTLTNASGVYLGGLDFTIYDSGAFWSGLIAHELGHYFSLGHTFNGACTNNNCLTNGDLVCDTPPKNSPGFNGTCAVPGNGCTTDEDDTSTNNPYRAIALGGMGDQPDMLANYLDYTGGCWSSYTEGQKVRMRANIDANRVALKNNSTACNIGLQFTVDAGISAGNLQRAHNCQGTFTPQITLNNYGTATLNTVTIKVLVDGVVASTQAWSGSLASGASTNVTITTPITVSIGLHSVSILTENPNGITDPNLLNDVFSQNIEYLGGTSCNTYAACSNFNANSDLGPGNTTVINLTQSFPGASSSIVQICVKVQGDVSTTLEVFNIIDESNTIQGQTVVHADCSGYSPEFCFNVAASLYDTWKSDGVITLTLDPISTSINPVLCTSNEACATINVPLPIELSSWKGTTEKDGNHLTWSTLTETNNEYFNVQYAANFPSGFKTVGKVDGAGNGTSLNKYSFLHNSTGQHHYYRLESVDFDGTKHLSKVIFLSSSIPKIVLAPNPVINDIVIQGDITAFGKVSFSIIDVTGKIHSTAILDRDRIDVSELPSGTYFLQIIGEWEMQYIRFIKLSN